jgi:Cdc6-like AAA superfamily ATPase
MDELFSGLKEKGKAQVFKNKSALSSSYLLSEEEVVDREEEIEAIARYIKQVLVGESSKFLLVSGPSGSGKTCIARFVLRKLQEEVENSLPMYLDCIASSTEHSILTELMRFFRHFYEGKGRGSKEIAQEFRELIRKDRSKPIVVLDNVDRVVDLERTLWRFSSLPNIGLILITTGKGNISLKLRQRAKTSFSFEDLVFKSYDSEELFQILKSRVSSAFLSPIPEKALRRIADWVEGKGGNAKIAFSLLLEAGEQAQWKGEGRITLEHIEEAIKKFERQGVYEKIEELRVKRGDEFKLLQQIAELESKGIVITTGELERRSQLIGLKLPPRTLRSYLEDLQRRKLITTKIVRKGSGRTREIRLSVPLDLVLA